jgi:exosortase/archaeosortase family protein
MDSGQCTLLATSDRFALPGASRPWLRFAMICTALLLAAFWLEPHLALLCRVTAGQVGGLLGLAGYAPQVQGDLVTLPGFSVQIITDCTPLYASLLYSAFVLAQPVGWWRTAAGLLAGVLVISAVNLLRISLVTAAGTVVTAWQFEILHVYLGQVAMLLLVLSLALAWQRRSADGPAPLPFLLRAGLIATALFPLWLLVNAPYMKALDSLVALLFSWAGYLLIIPYQHMVYYQTFNLVLLAALVLAEERFSVWQKFRRLCAGVALVSAGHLLFRGGNVLLTAFDWQPAFKMTDLMSICGEYLLPVLIWQYDAASSGRTLRQTETGS